MASGSDSRKFVPAARYTRPPFPLSLADRDTFKSPENHSKYCLNGFLAVGSLDKHLLRWIVVKNWGGT